MREDGDGAGVPLRLAMTRRTLLGGAGAGVMTAGAFLFGLGGCAAPDQQPWADGTFWSDGSGWIDDGGWI
jgi:hypothetical protein